MLILLVFVVEILIRRHHSSSEQPLDYGRFRVSRADEGTLRTPRSSERNLPLVQAYWSSKNQISIWPSTAELPCLEASSTSEEWVKIGRK